MIFVTVGSQKFQFNRLLQELDKLVEQGEIEDEIFAQTGYSDYNPQFYKYKNFLNKNEFKSVIEKSQVVISHAGTGALITAIKCKKKVIAVPRLGRYGEHVDDHQLQITTQFAKMNLILPVYDIKDLKTTYLNIDMIDLKEYISNTDTIIETIDIFLSSST